MKLSEQVDVILTMALARAASPGSLFLKLAEVTHEMAKRIEALEEQQQSFLRKEAFLRKRDLFLAGLGIRSARR